MLVGTSFQDLVIADFDSLNSEGYVSDIEEGRIVLCSRDPAGTFYAYETLKHF
ncbi:TPA: hypothetical protein EYP70_02595 [Candidatus Bathyarchaeota archaeon]|nr:hypothetical protein [Candidatus Bathyarchaeota archaeon]